jgi:hypothetical protein
MSFIRWIKQRESSMGRKKNGEKESFTDAALKSLQLIKEK